MSLTGVEPATHRLEGLAVETTQNTVSNEPEFLPWPLQPTKVHSEPICLGFVNSLSIELLQYCHRLEV